MPAGDITHPVPDLTGYITEGQLVLSAEMYSRGVYPPMDPLSSLSRLMRHGAGRGRTRDDHLDVAAQTLAALARARRVGELAELIGAAALSATDQRYLTFEEMLQRTFLGQRRDESRTLDESLNRAWQALATLPRRELTMVSSEQVAQHLGPESPDRPAQPPDTQPDKTEGADIVARGDHV
jgi:V/A-type H+-transporting ATPase subunit B